MVNHLLNVVLEGLQAGLDEPIPKVG